MDGERDDKEDSEHKEMPSTEGISTGGTIRAWGLVSLVFTCILLRSLRSKEKGRRNWVFLRILLCTEYQTE